MQYSFDKDQIITISHSLLTKTNLPSTLQRLLEWGGGGSGSVGWG